MKAHVLSTIITSRRVLFLLLAVFTVACREAKQDPRSSLITAYSAMRERPVPLRLSGFPYVPPPRPMRGTAEPAESLPLHSAAYFVLATNNDVRTRSAAEIILGNMDRATAELARAVAADPSDGQSWNDYAVALFEQARRHDDVTLLSESLGAIDRAISESPHLEAAFFNRAKILESLSIHDAAVEAWKTYLLLDTTSEWANEARAALRNAKQKTTREEWNVARAEIEQLAIEGSVNQIVSVGRPFTQQMRTWAETEYLGRWGAAETGNSEEATRWLTIARQIAAALKAISGERLAFDEVSIIDRAPSDAIRKRLAHAHVIYQEGRKLYSQRKVAESLLRFEDAEREFRATATPMMFIAAYCRSNALLDLNRVADAEVAVEEGQQDSVSDHIALRAQNDWQRANLLSRSGHLHEALRAISEAEALFTRLGEMEYAARMH